MKNVDNPSVSLERLSYRLGHMIIALILGLASAVPVANAQETDAPVRTRAIEIVDSPEPTPFADRARSWPTLQTTTETRGNDARSLGDQLNSISGVYTRESGSPTISIRGSTQSDRVLKLFDGVPLNLADGLGASDLFLPEEAVGDFRIIKGPATVFYGPSAMGGAVDHGLRWYERKGVRLGAAADEGHLDTQSAFAVLPLRFDEIGSSRAQLTAFRRYRPGDFHYTSVSGSESGRREHNGTDLTRVTAAGELRARGILFRPRALFATQKGEIPDSLAPSAFPPGPPGFEKQGTLFALDAEASLDNDSILGARVSDSRLHTNYSGSTSFSTRSTAALDYALPVLSFVRVHNFADLNYGEFTASYYGDKRFYDSRTDLGQVYDIALVPGPTANAAPVLALHPSFRYMTESGDFTRAVAVTSDTLSSQFRLSFAEGLRLPSLADRFASYMSYVGNPYLRPERSQSLEFGWLSSPQTRGEDLRDGYTADAAVFHSLFLDCIDSASADGGNTTKVNTGTCRAQGAELSIGYSKRTWNFTTAYGYLDARNTGTGESLRLAPYHQLTVSAARRFGIVVAELKDTFWSEFKDREVEGLKRLRTLPAWSSLDFTLRTQGLRDWEIEAGVINIADQPRELTIGFPEPQRRLHLSAMRNF